MNLIEVIENLCNEHEKDAENILAEIRKRIQNEKSPDFSKIKNGDHFNYRGIEFIRLGLEQGGVLCIVAESIGSAPFDTNGCNDWRKSSLRKKLNTEFLARLNESDLLSFNSDLTADNGDDSYGECVDKVGILSCNLYRKYRKFVPLYDDWMWTCTPWYCKKDGNAYYVRLVFPDGTLHNGLAVYSHALAPACIFNIRNQ